MAYKMLIITKKIIRVMEEPQRRKMMKLNQRLIIMRLIIRKMYLKHCQFKLKKLHKLIK